MVWVVYDRLWLGLIPPSYFRLGKRGKEWWASSIDYVVVGGRCQVQ
jgi:hypothetical protein